MRLTFAIAFLFAQTLLAQVPGKALKLSGQNQYVSFGEVLNNVRTISFWISPSQHIDSTNASEIPILVRDENGPQIFGTGEFAIFFGRTGTDHAGRITFTRATIDTEYSIHSDGQVWSPKRWYHVAAVLHPQQGMQLYINGILQQDTHPSTAPIYIRNEGPTGSLFLGKWGAVTGYGLQAIVDELQFYNNARTQQEIRTAMCKIGNLSSSALLAYYDFDAANAIFIPAVKGTINGTSTGLSASANVNSNAPVGENSSFLYNIQPGSSLSISEQATLYIDSANTNALGVHLYVTHDASLAFQGSYPYFFGVWFTDTVATYNAKLSYNSLSNSCDSCSELSSRDHQNISNWNTRNVYASNCAFKLKSESPGAKSWREEYWLKHKLMIKSGLDDTISECEGNAISLIPTNYPGATYLWDDGSTQRIRNVDSTGNYVVTIKWHGCTQIDTTTVIREYLPYFELPNDTAICAGDTLILVAPLDIDSATYNWGNGLHFGRKYRMYSEGTISLTITVGNCSWTDAITVDLIRPFQLALGKDTLLCLGETLELEAPKNVDYYWSTGDTRSKITVFNQPQTIWIKAWNSCFEKSDTITIDYEECDCRFFMANSFTPNNDGLNDVFTPVTGCYFEEFEMQIFDRWGEIVFQSNDVSQPWDGTYKGNELPQGVYTWQLRYKKYTWKKETKFQRGTLNLIR